MTANGFNYLVDLLITTAATTAFTTIGTRSAFALQLKTLFELLRLAC
jgi:hypothetical protein